MKKITLVALAGILFNLMMFYSCAKEKNVAKESSRIKDTPVLKSVIRPKPDSCATVSSKGRVIGINVCRPFTDSVKVMGKGFIIEIDNGAIRDTAVTYGLPDGIFKFFASYLDPGYFGLFKKEIQDKLSIKFNYRWVPDNEKTAIPCISFFNYALWTNGKEIFITCVSATLN